MDLDRRLPHTSLFLTVILAAALCLSGHSDAVVTRSLITIDKDRRISGTIQGLTVAETLGKLSEKLPLQITGKAPSDPVVLNFDKLTLEEALRKIMKGYNYVLVEPGGAGTTVLSIVGKAERSQGTENTGNRRPDPAPSVTPAPSPSSEDKAPAPTQEAERAVEPNTPETTAPVPEPPPIDSKRESSQSADPTPNQPSDDSSNKELSPAVLDTDQDSDASDMHLSPGAVLRRDVLDNYMPHQSISQKSSEGSETINSTAGEKTVIP